MSLIGQPENYSDILKRIFAATLTAGVLCTFALAAVSPTARRFLESWQTETSIGILDGVKALYILIPLLIAVMSRVFRLHDRISDFLGIRKRFDLKYILKPLAQGIGIPVSGPNWNRIEERRKTAMTRTFYRYASFQDPKIDLQLVRAAADRWAWFWCTVEPQVVLLVAGLIFMFLDAVVPLLLVLLSIGSLALIGCLLWPQMQRGAGVQVQEILHREDWKAELRTTFGELAAPELSAAQQGAAGDGPAPRARP